MPDSQPSSRQSTARPVITALVAFASLVAAALVLITCLVYTGRALQR